MSIFRLLVTQILVSAFTIGSYHIAKAQDYSVAHEWSETLLEAIRNDFARPTVHARNLFHTSMAMYDCWAVYGDEAETYMLGKTVDGFACNLLSFPMPTDIEAAREEAMSYAAYRLIRHRFQNSPGVNVTLANLENLMNNLGYDTDFTSVDYLSGNPAALGNYLAGCIINFGLQDQSQEQFDYTNFFYEPVNDPLVTNLPGNPDISDLNRWQPLTLDVFIDQSGNPIPFNTPPFLSPEWGQVTPFALSTDDLTIYNRDGFDYWVYHDPGPPPYADIDDPVTTEQYQWGFSLVNVWSSHLDPADSPMIDISPGSIGNVPLDAYPETMEDLPDFYDYLNGGDPSAGHDINPATGMPYEEQIVPLADYARILAEFWADGPDSETPPGHWFTLLNYVNEHPQFEKRWKGQGPVLDDLEWDVKSYFLMGSTMHDVAITAWGMKGWYDYVRPISAIRAMGDLGQSTDPTLANYHPLGMPLVPGYIEVVELGDPLGGANSQHVGKIKIKAWRGPEFIDNPVTDVAGVDWILAENWWPYQRPSFVTPNFAGFVSGHSTYSRAAADLMTTLTGDEYFPGGMGEFEAPQDNFLVFERGPSVDVTLQWATYRDASDQCSLSRIWGGIHPPADDIPGRLIGSAVAADAFALAETYFYRDEDNDGYLSYNDCNDNDPNINPGASEICDGIDNNCNNLVDDELPVNTYYLDEDNDGFGDGLVALDTCLSAPPMGYVAVFGDCNDGDATINSAALEICDGIDNNCDGNIDEGLSMTTYFRDFDEDGFGDMGVSVDTCLTEAPFGFVDISGDCNDTDPLINPDASEICDDIDNNCDGNIDEGISVISYYMDEDNDGFGDGGAVLESCQSTPPAGYVAVAGDCDDTNFAINPNATELCDNIDNDCNGLIDDGLEQFVYYADNDEDGFGDPADFITVCETAAPMGYVLTGDDCDDADFTIYPGAEEIPDNDIDEDCTGLDLFSALKVFPNPVKDELEIRFPVEGNMLLQIVSADGKMIYDSDIMFSENRGFYDFTDLAAGIYWVRLQMPAGREVFVQKVVKF